MITTINIYRRKITMNLRYQIYKIPPNRCAAQNIPAQIVLLNLECIKVLKVEIRFKIKCQ